MKTGWMVTGLGIAVLAVGIALFGRHTLATENWQAIVTTMAGLLLVGFGFRSIRGVAISRAVLVAIGVFLVLLSSYALFRVEWRISAAPEIIVLAAAGIASILIGNRPLRGSTAVGTPTV